MARQAGRTRTKKRLGHLVPLIPLLPPPPVVEVTQESPRTARRRLQRASNPEINYCDKTIRIPRRAYELAHGIRRRAIEKASAGVAVDVTFQLGLGRMIQQALQEFGERHGLLPLEALR